MTKILVIDDDASLREIIQLSLEHAGFEVIEADNGAHGVQQASAHLPDLILCDVRMEKMDGYRTLAALRQDSVTAPIPFILMTGQADTAGMRQGMELGADDYLSKPFTVPQLLAAVNARLKKLQTVREQAERKLADLRANISLALPHELLTPLNGILGFSDIIITDHAHLQPEEVVSMAEAIRDSAERLQRLIENFLIYAQLELLQIDQLQALREGQTSDLRRPVERVARTRAERVGRSDDLVLKLCDADAAIAEDYFTKVTGELLENAFKFSAPGSPVQVETGEIWLNETVPFGLVKQKAVTKEESGKLVSQFEMLLVDSGAGSTANEHVAAKKPNTAKFQACWARTPLATPPRFCGSSSAGTALPMRDKASVPPFTDKR